MNHEINLADIKVCSSWTHSHGMCSWHNDAAVTSLFMKCRCPRPEKKNKTTNNSTIASISSAQILVLLSKLAILVCCWLSVWPTPKFCPLAHLQCVQKLTSVAGCFPFDCNCATPCQPPVGFRNVPGHTVMSLWPEPHAQKGLLGRGEEGWWGRKNLRPPRKMERSQSQMPFPERRPVSRYHKQH